VPWSIKLFVCRCK